MVTVTWIMGQEFNWSDKTIMGHGSHGHGLIV